MRKLLLLMATAMLPFLSTSQTILSDDFESYTAGQLLAANSDLWTTWSGGVDAEDATVSSDQASSGTNSTLIEGTIGPTDLILPFPEDYTSGVYEITMKMYVASGYGGYWNVQESSTPGQGWLFEIYLDDAGGGYLYAGGANAATVSYTPDTWFDVKLHVDLDADWAQFYLGGNMIYEWQWSLGADGSGAANQLGGMDFFAYAAGGADCHYYFDDIKLAKILPTVPGELWDDFESYTADALLASQSDLWTTWSGGVDGEDAYVRNSEAVTGSQSVNIVGTVGPTDLILPFPEDYTTGVYEFSCKMYVVNGNGGYWNIQQSSTPGLGWMFEIYLDDDGTGYISAGGANAASVTYTPDTWMSLNVWVDLDNDLARFYMNSHLVYEWQWSLGADGSGAEKSIGGLDFFAYAANGASCNYYLDNVLLQQHTTTGVFVDDFEDFVPGTLLAANSDIWTTWSGGVDGEDATVNGLVSYDGFNSFNVVGSVGPTDLILPFPDDYTTGVYDLSLRMNVASGNGGYFNIQQSSTPGLGWMFEIYLDDDGTGYISAGGANAANVTYTPDTWMELKFHIDLTNDQAEFYMDGNLIYTWQWSLGADGTGAADMLGGMDFFAYAANGATCNYYIDDVVLTEAIGTGTPATQFNPGVIVYPNPSNGNFTVRLDELTAGEYQIQLVDMLGKIISNETVNLTGSVSRSYDLSVPAGIYHFRISNGSETVVKKIMVN